MIRGGDTPKQETLWAIEFESGKFAFGQANENQIFVATSGIGREIWYADDRGVITGSTESVDEVTDTIVDTYNQYFGTKISNLTPDTELFKVGDTVHNWNTYERIYGLYGDKIAINVGNGGNIVFAVGALSNGIFRVISNNDKSLVVNENGQIITLQGAPSSVVQYWQGMLARHELSASGVFGINTSYEVGQNINDWQSYTQYK